MAFIKCVLFGHEKSELLDTKTEYNKWYEFYNCGKKDPRVEFLTVHKRYKCAHCGVTWDAKPKKHNLDGPLVSYYQTQLAKQGELHKKELDRIYSEIDNFKNDPYKNKLPIKHTGTYMMMGLYEAIADIYNINTLNNALHMYRNKDLYELKKTKKVKK